MNEDELDVIRDHPDRFSRERRYYSILSTIRMAGGDRPGMSLHSILANRTMAGHTHRNVRKSIRAAESNGDIVAIPDQQDHTRYVLTDDESLREAINWLASWDDADKQTIGHLNRMLYSD